MLQYLKGYHITYSIPNYSSPIIHQPQPCVVSPCCCTDSRQSVTQSFSHYYLRTHTPSPYHSVGLISVYYLSTYVCFYLSIYLSNYCIHLSIYRSIIRSTVMKCSLHKLTPRYASRVTLSCLLGPLLAKLLLHDDPSLLTGRPLMEYWPFLLAH